MARPRSQSFGALFLPVLAINLHLAGLNLGMGMVGNNPKLTAFGWMLTVPCAVMLVSIMRLLLSSERDQAELHVLKQELSGIRCGENKPSQAARSGDSR